MPKNEPKRLFIEYDDGFTREIEFSKLSRDIQVELSKLTGFRISMASSLPQKYLLVKWKDAWEEVRSIDATCVELLRYYAIERIEEVGRLVITRSGHYPLVQLIVRLPRELEKISLTDGKNTKNYAVGEVEGTRIEGGRTEYQYRLDSIDVDYVEEITERLKKALRNSGTKAEELLAKSEVQKIEKYKKLRKEIGLKASRSEGEVLTFVGTILKRLASIP